MRHRVRQYAFCGSVAVVVALGFAWPAAANGAAFFAPADRNAKKDLMYVGSIRDRAGRPLDFADLIVSVNDGSMTFPFSNDSPGHYRSPDVGALIKEAGETVDPTQLAITCYVTGFKHARRSVPKRSRGIFEVNFVMDEDAGGADKASVRDVPAGRTWRIPATGLLVLFVTAAGARIATRLLSTGDSDCGST
jgi:hypothetical protein